MSNEFGTLAHHWSGSFSQVQGWLISRKLNGWSVLWDGGVTSGMPLDEIPWYHKGGDDDGGVSYGLWNLGRNGKVKKQDAPLYFLEALPKGVPAHGELWYNDNLRLIKRVARFKAYYKPEWQVIKFIAFGAKPAHLWGAEHLFIKSKLKVPLTNYETLRLLRSFENDKFKVIETEWVTCTGTIDEYKKKAVKEGWEGLMFQNPEAFYECKRSHNNLKWKQSFETEATVHGYKNGKNRNEGRVGSIEASLVWDSKITTILGGTEEMVGEEAVFYISGLRDDERDFDSIKELYPAGEKIRFKFDGVTRDGIPYSPRIYRGM